MVIARHLAKNRRDKTVFAPALACNDEASNPNRPRHPNIYALDITTL